MTSEILYIGGLRTEAKHIKSGQDIITDAPIDNQGKGEAFSPTDLTATSLGTCMLTIMGIRARNNGWNIDGTRATIQKVMSSEPRKISKIIVDIYLPQKYDGTQYAELYDAAVTCPVALSLHPEISQEVNFHLPE